MDQGLSALRSNPPTDARLWEETERALREVDRRCIVLPLMDVIIGCSALRVGAVVLTYNHRFSQIPRARATDRLDV